MKICKIYKEYYDKKSKNRFRIVKTNLGTIVLIKYYFSDEWERLGIKCEALNMIEIMMNKNDRLELVIILGITILIILIFVLL